MRKLLFLPLLFVLLLNCTVKSYADNYLSTAVQSQPEWKTISKQAFKKVIIQEETITYKASGKNKPDNDSTKQYEDDRVRRKAKWAKFLGIGSLVGLLLPVVGVLSLPAAIVAIITGNQAKHDAPDRRSYQDAKTGVITGWITVGVFILAVLLIILIIAAFAHNWG